MKLINQATKLPKGPGVYFFLNKKGKVSYIGRATSLRRRALSYFQKNLNPRLIEMVDLTYKIKYKKTDTILESVILEANLIKKYWPKYNVRERDNRSFLYIVIPKTDYPYPILVRQRELQKFLPKGEIFGPYKSFSLIKSALRIIRRIFPYSTCRPFCGKPCFDYQIGLCPGLCIGEISKEEYRKNIDDLILFLKGEKKRLLKKLKKENPLKLWSLKHIQDVSLISKEEFDDTQNRFNRIEGYDISHLSGREPVGAMVVFTNGVVDRSQYRLFKIKKAPKGDDLSALKEVISRRFNHKEWSFPDLIIVDGGKPQVDFVDKILKSNFINIPTIGISKLGGDKSRTFLSKKVRDKLVFIPKTKKSFKELAQSMKDTLLKVRNEAHRFALKSSRYQRRLK